MAKHTLRLTDVPFRLFIESVQEYAIFMLDTEGYIVSWNDGAHRIKGYTDEEILGKHFSIFYTQEDLARRHPEYELRVARDTGRYEEEGWRLRKDGTRFWSSIVITAVRNSDGELLGFGKVTRDLTQRKTHEETERRLRRERSARAEAEAASRAKSQFLTTMSHELRTPLNAILGYVDLLELGVQGTLTADQLTSLERVRKSSKHLLGLINDILNLARIEQGHVDYDMRIVSANEMLAGVEPLVTPQFIAHGVDFQRIACGGDVRVFCDPEKTRQILLNLLTNAYKFTDPGGRVVLGCSTADTVATFVVTDSGRGIPPEKLASIFEPFVQIDRHLNTESQQGVGLGLSISRQLARDMHGDLTVISEPGGGSTFTLTLPLAQDTQPVTATP